MRFWFSVPFIRRTRIGISVSDREIARAFHRNPPTPTEMEQRAIEEAIVDAKSKAFAARWSPWVAFVMWVIILWTIWHAILWLF
jgi:hypothetical protein